MGGPAHYEWCHPWAADPGFYKKVDWVSYRDHTRKQRSALVSASVSASRFLPGVLPWLPSVDCDLGYVSQTSPFSPELFLVSVLFIAIETLIKTGAQDL